MAIVDQAIVEIIANTSGYVSGVRDVTRETAEAQRAAKEWEQSGKAVGQMIAGLVTGLAALTLHTLNQTAALNDLSQQTGLSTEVLSSFNRVAGLNGVALEGVATSATFLARSIAENKPAFAAMGVQLRDNEGNLRSMDAVFEDVAVTLAGFKDDAKKTALEMELFGRSGAQLTAALNQAGTQGFAAMREEARALGVEISGATATAADDLGDKLADLKNLADGFANTLVADLLPNVTALGNEMGTAAQKGEAMRDMAQSIATAIQYLGGVFLVIKNVVEGFVNLILAGVDTIVGGLKIMNGVVDGMMHDAAAINKALQFDFAGAKDEWQKAGQAVADGWREGADQVKIAWMAATSGIDEASERGERQFNALTGKMEEVETEAQRVKKAIDAVFAKQGFGEGYVTTLPTETVYAPKPSAPDLPKTGSGDDAAEKAKKLADELAKLNESLDDGIQKFGDMADGFVEAMTPMEQVERDFGKAVADVSLAAADQVREIEKARDAGLSNNEVAQRYIELQVSASAALAAATEARKVNAAAAAQQEDVTGRFVAELTREAAMIGKTAKQQKIEEVALRALAEAKKLNVTVDEARIRKMAEVNATMQEASDILEQIEVKSPFQTATDQIKTLREEVERLSDPLTDAFDPERVKRLNAAITAVSAGSLEQFAGSISASLSSIQSMTKEGSRSYEALGLAIQATTIVEGIAAVVHQLSSGDVYTAIPRAAAVAAAIASLGVNVKSFAAGGFSDTAGSRQATQGTGSVLGDAEAKSESIAHAVEITADATTELVGLNRGMLNALQALQNGLGSAGGLLARGAGEADFSGLDLSTEGDLSIFEQNDVLGRLIGGSSKITDQGIIIFGGALNDLLENVAVGAYQEVQSRSSLFGSTHTREGIVDVSDQFGQQFSLVITSIVDAVRAGAEALGILPEDIQAALDAFAVEEIRISLKDLSAEEQQAELTAVFSQIFDGLAGSIVPFIEQFQQVGEGLGETLVRVATGVQVTQEAMRQLGLAIATTDPEQFAQISEGLIGAVGSIQDFISGMQSFVAAFAPESHQFDIAAAALTSSLAQVGLTVPDTRDAMWTLMQSLDATTEEGRAQIAILLRMTSAADTYYDSMEQAAAAFKKAAEDLRNTGRALAESLWGTPLSNLEAQIAEMQSAMGGLDSAVDYSASGIESAVDRMRSAISLLLGDLSPLNDEQKLQAAMDGLMRGTVSQEEVLEIGRRLYASTAAYNELFAQVQQYAGYTGSTSNDYSGSATTNTGSEAQLADLIAQRDAILEQQRVDQGRELADIIAQYSDLQGINFEDAAAAMNTQLSDLGELLGLNADELTAYLENLTGANDRIPDSITTNTDRLIDAIRAIGTADTSRVAPTVREANESEPSADGSLVATSVDRTTRAVERLSDTLLGIQGRGNYP